MAIRGVFLSLTLTILVCIPRSSFAQIRSDVRIVSDVELVRIPVTVFDDKGSVASNLKKGDFLVLEDGIEQNILRCDREREPVSFVILDDLSSSMTKKIPFVLEATLSVLEPVEAEAQYGDEFSVFSVASRVTRLTRFTRDQQDLERRLPLLLTATNGSTALFDGIYWGVSTVNREAENNRSAVIIISDGGDNHSRYNLRETKAFLEEADVPVFAVMAGPSFELPEIFGPRENGPSSYPNSQKKKAPLDDLLSQIPQKDYIGPAERRGPHNLQVLTAVTGGGVFTARNLQDLPRIVRTIALAVRYRYVLAYEPILKENDGVVTSGEAKWHKIHIELRPKGKFAGYGIPYYKPGYSRIE
jgi:Ca-activated chloride channel homolog